MRIAAALLLVALIGPSTTSVICELACVHHEHHSARAASGQDCHDHRSNDGPAVTAGAAATCHDRGEVFTATAADFRVLKAAAADTQFPSSLTPHHLQPWV